MRARVFVAIFLANLVAVIAIWWLGSGARTSPRLSDELNDIGRVTGLVGTYLVLVQLLLRTHVPWLVTAFGKDALRLVHTRNAYLALGLLAIHGVFQTIGYALDDQVGILNEIGTFIAHYDGVLLAIIGLVLLAILTAISLEPVRHRMPWPTWRGLHLVTYVAVAVSVPHQIATGADFVDAPVAVVYWSVLYVAVVGVIALTRIPPVVRSVRESGFPGMGIPAIGAAAVAAYLLLSVKVTAVPVLALPTEAPPSPSPRPGATGIPAGLPGKAVGTFDGDVVATPYGNAQVEITVAAGQLTDVEWVVMPHATSQSRNRSVALLPWLQARTLKAQSADIDIVSGATYTSNAYKESLESALRLAGFGQ